MTYKIICTTNGESFEIANSAAADLLPCKNIELSKELNRVDSLSFTIAATHPYRDKIKPIKSVIKAYVDDELVFDGRPLAPAMDWLNNSVYACESCLAYFNDSLKKPYSLSGTADFILSEILDGHNEQVEDEKKIYLGRITNTDGMALDNTEISTTWECLESFLELATGYLFVRTDENGVHWLDYLSEAAPANTQEIRFGQNLLDLSKYQTIEDMKTALIPYGATLDDGTVVGIASVNDGSDFIYSQEAVDEYGWIWATCTWDGITDPQELLNTATEYFEQLTALPETIELSAVDLAAINEDISRFHLGGMTTMVSEPHGIRKQAILSQKVMNLDAPQNDTITIGTTSSIKTFTRSTDKAVRNIKTSVEQHADASSRFSQFATGGRGGNVVMDYDNDSVRKLPYRILIMDEPDKATAKCVLQLNKDGIGFSSNGVNGDYYNSWTIDGQLSLGGTDNAYGALQILDPSGNVIGAWTKDGIVVNAGTVDLRRNTNFGLYIDGTIFRFGDFEVNDRYGRQIIQSSDEKTGMSGEPNGSGLYLWAGYTSDSDCVFKVGKTDAFVQYDGETYPIGESIDTLNRAMEVADEENQGPDIGDLEGSYAVVGGLNFSDIFG